MKALVSLVAGVCGNGRTGEKNRSLSDVWMVTTGFKFARVIIALIHGPLQVLLSTSAAITSVVDVVARA